MPLRKHASDSPHNTALVLYTHVLISKCPNSEVPLQSKAVIGFQFLCPFNEDILMRSVLIPRRYRTESGSMHAHTISFYAVQVAVTSTLQEWQRYLTS